MQTTQKEVVQTSIEQISEFNMDKPFAEIVLLLKDTYETKHKTVLTNAQIAEAAGMNKDEFLYRRRDKKPIGDIAVRNIINLSKFFDIPIIQTITGENYNYKLIKKRFGLNTPAIEWLKAHQDNTEIDYIGILNIILGDSKIAELVIKSFYLYCMKDIYNFSEFEARGEIMENLVKAMELVSARYEPMKIDNMEKQLEIILKDIKIAKDSVDEELQQIAIKKGQDTEDFEAEAQEYNK